jgi:hypothetical protein
MFADFKAAHAEAKSIANKLAQGELDVLHLRSVDRRPVAVEHQHNRLVQYVGHIRVQSCVNAGACSLWVPVRRRRKMKLIEEMLLTAASTRRPE